LAQDIVLLRRQLRAPLGVGLLDLEFLGGVRRLRAQPAEAEKTQQAGDRGKQNAAIHDDFSVRAVCPRYGWNTAEVTPISGPSPHINARTGRAPAHLRQRCQAAEPAAAANGAHRAANGAEAARGPALRPGDWPRPGAPRARVPSAAPVRGNAL